MSYAHEISNPAERIYRNRKTGKYWTIELEIGGAAWISDGLGTVLRVRMTDFASNEWERVA